MGLQYTYGEDSESDGLTPQQLLIIAAIAIGVLITAIVFVAGTVFLSRNSRQPTAPAETVNVAIPTAREAYVPAVEAIRAVDLGAQLASASGSWNPVVSQVHLAAGRTGWTFHFFLPASSEMARVVVDQGGATRVAEILPWETPPQLLDDQSWELDSSAAMAAFIDACGGALNDSTSVESRLSLAASNRQLVWDVVVYDAGSNAVCDVSIDGTTGRDR